MTMYLMLREVAEGQANLVGITEDTALTPRQIADAWVSSRGEIEDPVRLHFADVTNVKTIDVDPEIVRKATTRVVPPGEAFSNPTIIDVPDTAPPTG